MLLSTKRLSSAHVHKIVAVLEDLNCVDVSSAQFDIQDIFAGTINRNYKVSDGRNAVLLKVFEQSSVLPISRAQVFTLQQKVSAVGLSPKPIFLSKNEDFYIEEWIDGFTPDSKQYTYNSLARLAGALYQVHHAHVSAPTLPLLEHWHKYWTHIKHPSEALTETFSALKIELQAYLEAQKPHFVLCHNDLNITHICEQTGVIIDWEYAAYGCRYFDIANCVAANQLNKAQTAILCEQYGILSEESADAILKKVQTMSKFVHFTNKLWNISVGISA